MHVTVETGQESAAGELHAALVHAETADTPGDDTMDRKSVELIKPRDTRTVAVGLLWQYGSQAVAADAHFRVNVAQMP